MEVAARVVGPVLGTEIVSKFVAKRIRHTAGSNLMKAVARVVWSYICDATAHMCDQYDDVCSHYITDVMDLVHKSVVR